MSPTIGRRVRAGGLPAALLAGATLAALGAPGTGAAADPVTPAPAAPIATVLLAPEAPAPAPPFRTGRGEQPVWAALARAGDQAFRATDTLVPATIAKQPGDGFTLATATGELSVVPVGVDSAAPAGSVAVTGAAVVFPSIDRHVDALVSPRPDGIETFTTLRDARAPTRHTWKLDLPGRERLVPTAAGGVQIVDPSPQAEAREPASDRARAADTAAQAVLAPVAAATSVAELEPESVAGGGEVVAEIAPPVAVDASGANVPTTLDVRGDEVTMRVDARGAVFPVVADPYIRARPYRIATVEDFDLAAGSNCKRSFQRRVLESLLGTDLAWVKLKKHFCWDRSRRRVTYAEGVVEYDTTGAGSLAQWDVDGVTSRNERYFPWRGHPRGGHQSLAAVRFQQSALGWGVDSATLTTEIRGRYDGSVRKP